MSTPTPIVPEGLKLRPFQLEGVAKLIERQGLKGQLLADEMGLGKTVQAIAFGNTVEPERKKLVVCPASLRANWGQEIERWAVRPDRWYVRSYDIATRDWEKYSGRNRWGMLVVDECHMVKNEKAKRTRMLAGGVLKGRPPSTTGWKRGPLISSAKRSLWMSGTPITNRPSEFIPVLAAMGALEELGGREKFSRYYCQGHYEGR